ncbi:hypothetical protein LZ554_004119 [Drepanopeziza brunnea f. sp. 'monogermtubi']|nr:hypothetical protein LZ554_004119 [Drepanopeziza brunnea f. sp. 'monogermtubi']
MEEKRSNIFGFCSCNSNLQRSSELFGVQLHQFPQLFMTLPTPSASQWQSCQQRTMLLNAQTVGQTEKQTNTAWRSDQRSSSSRPHATHSLKTESAGSPSLLTHKVAAQQHMAVKSALRANKMDLAIGTAVGSETRPAATAVEAVHLVT